jgi:predicted ATPase
VAVPERLFQAEYPGMPQQEFPPLKTEGGHAGHLPLQFTRFFGREEEIARLRDLLLTDETRLVTLTGAGGTGKTRLALAAADRLRKAFEGALWFVPLQDLADAHLILDKTVEALRLPRSPHVGPMEQLVVFLSRQPSLLLLDNFEHLVSEGAILIQTLLERVETLQLVVTSRHRLDLVGEREFPVGPLPVPVESYELSVERPAKTASSELSTFNAQLSTLAACPSVQLFVDRAQQVRPDFQVTQGNAAVVTELCERLEGIPLALELAAARAGVLTPAQMLAHLEHRFDFLVSRQRDTAARHRTLRAAIDWSYRLLTPELQRFFARLSVFRGGWTLEAAQAVCEQPVALDCLQELKESSLVAAETGGKEMRFRLLEMLREYGVEQLAPEERAALARRHGEYYLALAEAAEPHLIGADQVAWLDRLEGEHDNLRAALRWFAESGEAEDGCRLAAALERFWLMRGYWREGRERLAEQLERMDPETRTSARARALHAAGQLAIGQGDYRAAQVLHEESQVIWQRLGDDLGRAHSLGSLGSIALVQGNLEAARALHEESLALCTARGALCDRAGSLDALGHLARERCDYETARALHEESLTIRRARGDLYGIAHSVDSLGYIAFEQGDWSMAMRLHEESLAIRRALGDRRGITGSLVRLAQVVQEQGDYETARACYEESLAIQRELGARPGIAGSLNGLGQMAYCQADFKAAWEFFQESLTLARDLGSKSGVAEALQYLGKVARQAGDHHAAWALLHESTEIRRELGEKRGIAWILKDLAGVAWCQGEYETAHSLLVESLTFWSGLGDRVGIMVCLESLGVVACCQGQPGRAIPLFGAAQALRNSNNHRHPPPEQAEYDRHLTAARAQLGEDAFAAAWEAGQSMTLDEAVADALGQAPA